MIPRTGQRTHRARVALLAAGAAFFLLIASAPGAAGELSFGVNAGATYDVNRLGEDINRYNVVMEAYSDENPGSMTQSMGTPVAPAFGLSARYQFNQLLFRVGLYFATPVGSIEGYITPADGQENRLKISTFQISMPATVALVLPIKEKTYVYLGLGLTYHQIYVKMSQSNPQQTAALFEANGLSSHRTDQYGGQFGGYHILIGAEFPLLERLTLTVDWIHQEARSQALENKGTDANGAATTSPKRTFSATGDFAFIGVNYYLQI